MGLEQPLQKQKTQEDNCEQNKRIKWKLQVQFMKQTVIIVKKAYR